MIHIDMCAAYVDPGLREIELFVGYLQSVLLPRVGAAQGQLVVRTNANPMKNWALPLTRELEALTQSSATLRVVVASQNESGETESPGAGKPIESLAQRVKRLIDSEFVAELDADLPFDPSEDAAFARAV